MRYYGTDRRPRKDTTLQHWKYIKREKVGDKWKYYYDLDGLKSDVSKTAGNVADKVSGAARSVANKATSAAASTKKAVRDVTGVTAKNEYNRKSADANYYKDSHVRDVQSNARMYTEGGAASGKRLRKATDNLRNTEKKYDERLNKEATSDAERRKTLEDSYVSARDKRANAGLVSKAMFGKEMDKNVKDRSDALNAHDKNASDRRARTEAERDEAVSKARKNLADQENNEKFMGYRDGSKKQAIDARVRSQKDRRYQEQKAKEAYEKTLVGKVDKGVDTVKKGAKSVAKKAGEVYDDVSDAASDVKNWGSKTISDLSKSASKAVDSGKNWLEGLFGKKKTTKTGTVKLNPNGKTITENIITEKRIPEKRITENIITEKRITEKHKKPRRR